MMYLSLFSGIEAASVAWKPLGWTCVGVAEIDPFPCAVLSHHYPDVPNLGGVTDITDEQIAALGPIDVVVGGSPCQDLSVAGKRAGLAGERSGLFHEQLRIFHAARHLCGARFLVWENVPGAFSSHAGRDFAVVVGAMAGCRVDVPSDGWGTEGVALGEHGLVEWAVLDAQFFNLAQRRRRVFAVLDVGDWSSRPPILLEPDSLRGDSAPSREAREGAAETAGGGPDGGRVAGSVTSKRAKGTGGPAGDECYNLVAPTLRAGGNRTGGDRPPGTDVDTADSLVVTHTLRGEGFDAGEDGTGRSTPLVPVAVDVWNHAIDGDVAATLNAESGAPNHSGPKVMVPVPIQNATRRKDQKGLGIGSEGDPMYTLDQGSQHAIAFAADDYKDGGYEECDTARPLTTSADRTRAAPIVSVQPYTLAIRGRGDSHDLEYRQDGTANALLTPNGGRGGIGVGAVAFSCKDHGADAGEIAPTLRGMGHDGSHANGGGQVAVAFVQGELDGSSSETDPHSPLRALRQEIGAKAFAEWGLGILDSLQPSEILRQAVHGCGIRRPAFSRSWVVCCALGSPFSSAEGAVQSLREAGCAGRSPQGWEPSEQLARELGAYLSELSQPGAQAERLMRDLWRAAEGSGVLRQALSAVQDARRSSSPQAQPAHTLAVRRLTATECEFLQGFPRNYTDVPYRGKPAADGPRYKALGNSMAVPVMRWIGEAIMRAAA